MRQSNLLVGAKKVIEKGYSTAKNWVLNLVALLVDRMAATMVEELLDCLMAPEI